MSTSCHVRDPAKRAAFGCVPALAVSLFVFLAGAPLHANPVKSLYSTIELKECRPVKIESAEKAWHCPGLPRYPVLVAEGGSRQFVSFGQQAEKHRAASQSLAAPNTIFEGGSRRPTIEWRFVRHGSMEVPYAAIVSYYVGTAKTRVLVVFKVEPAQSCQIAYIDAVVNPEAIVIARQVADEEARGFDCRMEPRRIGLQAAR
jgi:hypothetical protein